MLPPHRCSARVRRARRRGLGSAAPSALGTAAVPLAPTLSVALARILALSFFMVATVTLIGAVPVSAGTGEVPASMALATAPPGRIGKGKQCAIGTPSSEFAAELSVSGERSQLWRLYQAFFLRQPDRRGLEYWVGVRQGGSSLSDVAYSFASGPEFQRLYGDLTDSDFVQLIYDNVLCRTPDGEGFSYWTGRLQTGAMTRPQMLINFTELREYLAKTSTCHSIFPVETAASPHCGTAMPGANSTGAPAAQVIGYLDDVHAARRNRHVVTNSPADHYARITRAWWADLRRFSDFTTGYDVVSSGQIRSWSDDGLYRTSIDLANFAYNSTGVTGFTVDGETLSSRLAVASTPMPTGQGVTVRDAIMYRMPSGQRLVMLTLTNNTSGDVTIYEYSSAFVAANGIQDDTVDAGTGGDIRPGATANVFLVFDSDPSLVEGRLYVDGAVVWHDNDQWDIRSIAFDVVFR